MNYKEKATELHEHGYNCAQAVLCSCCGKLGLDEKNAYALSAFFGGGMRRAEVCGAVSGALMALGLRYGDENNRHCKKSTEFLKEFQDKNGSIVCRELIGPEGMKKKELCPLLIEFAAEYLEKELEK